MEEGVLAYPAPSETVDDINACHMISTLIEQC